MLPGEPGIYHQGQRPPVEQLAPVLAPVHPPAVQVKYQGHPTENHKDTANNGCIFVFLLLLSAKRDGPEKDRARMVQGGYATRIQSLSDLRGASLFENSSPKSHILEDFGLE